MAIFFNNLKEMAAACGIRALSRKKSVSRKFSANSNSAIPHFLNKQV